MKKILSLVLSFALVLSLFTGIVAVRADESNKLVAGAEDTISVDTTNTGAQLFQDGDRYSFNKAAVTSLAEITNGVCAVQVANTWRWPESWCTFYDEVVSYGSWVYSPNAWANMEVPVITYNTAANTKVSFKLALRDPVASWDNISIKVSYGNEAAYTPSSDYLSYTEKDYPCAKGTMKVRSYELIVPKDGKLIITLPTAATLSDNTVAANWGQPGDAFVHSSALLIPATATKYVSAANGLTAGSADELIVDTTNTGAQLFGDADRYSFNKAAVTSLAELTNGVCAVQVSNTWRWPESWCDFYNEVVPYGSWVYSPNAWANMDVPVITYKVYAGTKVSFKIALRDPVASWDNISIKVAYGNEDAYVPSSEYLSYAEKDYPCAKGTMKVRSYELIVPSSGKLIITLPTAATISDNTVAANWGQPGDAFVHSSALLIPASAEVCYLNAGVSDSLTVDTSNAGAQLFTDADRYSFNMSAVKSLADTSGGVCAVQVASTWRWPETWSNFYDEVVPSGTWVYSANAWANSTIPAITYRVMAGTKVSFKIALRKQAASWDDVLINVSYGGAAYTPSEYFLSYTEKEYACTIGTMSVRSYDLIVPSTGKLTITLPTAASIQSNTQTAWGQDPNAIVHSGALLIPASAIECVIGGDLNHDAALNAADLVAFSKMLLENEAYDSADLNSDNNVNILDLIRLRKILATMPQ
ncbi:MAG: dockerin type I repeat-containing protein [Clostridia bacterium]|nr:dockerin type I repeat-containing protein [Clostridia bacterium]